MYSNKSFGACGPQTKTSNLDTPPCSTETFIEVAGFELEFGAFFTDFGAALRLLQDGFKGWFMEGFRS